MGGPPQPRGHSTDRPLSEPRLRNRHAAGRNDADEALRSYLIGDGPGHRYLPPQMRFLNRAMTSGFVCRISDRDCPACDSHATFAVDLPPTMPRVADGVRARICLACGSVRIEYWYMGQRTEIGSDGGDWVRLDGPVVGLKAALAERVEARYRQAPDAD
jgi:hypothetical protein